MRRLASVTALLGLLVGLLATPAAWAVKPMIAAGGNQTYALTSTGGVLCWGIGCGSGTVPVAFPGFSGDVTAIAADAGHSCAITSAGAAQCWGLNGAGQLGNGTNTNSNTPVSVNTLSSGVTAVAVGNSHSCALTNAGGVWCWGLNDRGQLGYSSSPTGPASVPVAVAGGLSSGVIAIATGLYHSCALMSSGTVKCWGDNTYGEIGDGTTNGPVAFPSAAVSGLSGVIAIAAGYYETCAVLNTGTVKCWGYNVNGGLGNGLSANSSTPVSVAGISGVTAIAMGSTSGHVCALTSVGGIWCWGANTNGELGIGTSGAPSYSPVQVPGLPSIASIETGFGATYAVASSGSVFSWGYNGFGQLGNGTTTNSNLPVQVWGIGGPGYLNLGTSTPTRTDLNGDGKSDLVWRQASTGGSVLWLMNGTAQSSSAYLGGSTDWSITATGDFNGDGKTDLVWRQASTGGSVVWLMNGSATSSSAYLGGDTDWRVVVGR